MQVEIDAIRADEAKLLARKAALAARMGDGVCVMEYPGAPTILFSFRGQLREVKVHYLAATPPPPAPNPVPVPVPVPSPAAGGAP